MDLFFASFKNDFDKETSFFEQGKVYDLVKVCIVFAFEKNAITIKHNLTTIKNTKEEGKQIQLEPEMLFFLTCQVRVVRFYQSCSPPPPPHPPPPPRSPDPSGHSRTSTASSRSPDLNRDFQIAVGTAGPQPRLPDRSGHCRTSTATSRSQWALPDLNGKNVRKDVR